MDDTIEHCLEAWVKGINAKYGCCASHDDVVSWDLTATFPDLSREQIYEIPMQPGFWKTVKPIADAPEVLRRLIAAGHEVYIVTATHYEAVLEKMSEVLFRYFPFLSWDQVIIAHRKQMIRGDVLIDDAIHNLEGGQYQKILMTAPHNASFDAEAHDMIRVHTWKEIEQVIARLSASD